MTYLRLSGPLIESRYISIDRYTAHSLGLMCRGGIRPGRLSLLLLKTTALDEIP